MKRVKILTRSVMAAADAVIGTTFYVVSLPDLIETLKKLKANKYLIYALESDGWDAIDLRHHLYGSQIINDKLYICVTDEKEVLIDGQPIDPETLLDEVDLKDLKSIVKPADSNIIKKYITEYEVLMPDVDEATIELLQSGNSLKDLVRDVEDAYPNYFD